MEPLDPRPDACDSPSTITRRRFVEFGVAGLGYFLLPSWSGFSALAMAKEPVLRPSYKLPLWFSDERIHAHTRVPLRQYRKPRFWKVAARVKKLGATVFVRNIKAGSEGAWWPSRVGKVVPQAKTRNLAKEIIDSAHREGLKLIVYYRHMEDAAMSEAHPDWVCVDWKGRRLHSKRGDYMCFNSPYADFLLERLSELTQMGADGLYFDEVHMPKTGCWCRFCQAKYKAETGRDVPVRANEKDSLWHHYIDFNNRTIEDAFVRWRQALHRMNPSLVMVVSAHKWNAICERHLTGRLFESVDSVKTEFNSGLRILPTDLYAPPPGRDYYSRDVKQALAFVMARDAAGGRPAHVWIFNVREKKSALHAAAGVLTHGCIANMDLMGPRKARLPVGLYRDVFRLGSRVSPFLKGMAPFRGVALVYPEKARDEYVLNPRTGFEQIVYPFYCAFHVLLRARIPVGVVTEPQLEEGLLDGYQVLVLPDFSGWSEGQKDSVRLFEQRGGKVVLQKETGAWGRLDGLEVEGQKLLRSCMPFVSVPLRVTGGPERLHTSIFVSGNKKKYTLTLCNDFSWVKSGHKDREWAGIPPREMSPPGPCSNVEIEILDQNISGIVSDIVRSKALSVVERGGRRVLRVPEFEYFSVLSLEA